MSRARIRFLSGGLLLVVGLTLAGEALAQDVLGAVRAGRWAEADAAASGYADPVAAKLVTYYRMLAPGGASASEIAAFMDASPDWPQQALLARRRDEALVNEPDDATAAALCTSVPPKLSAAWRRCAMAFQHNGQAAAANEAAGKAWILGITDAPGETAFLKQWGGALSSADQAARFDHLAWGSETAAATRQLGRLDGPARAVGEARLALKRDDGRALQMVAALPASGRQDPGLVLEQARYLRRNGFDSDAAALWKASGTQAEREAGKEHAAAFWGERNTLARRLLRSGDPQGAYAVAAGSAQFETEQLVDAEFLAGFIALRKLSDPARATMHFQKLAKLSKAAITQGRAGYWLGRAAAAAGQDPGPYYRTAAAYPTTYYGQLAALALGDTPAALNARIDAARDPGWDNEQVLAFAGREVTRAAAILVAWGDPGRARAFLLRLTEIAPGPADISMNARLALGLGLPDQAVALARRAGREGYMLPVSGWPMPVEVPDGGVEPAVALAIIRQESSFDIAAVSPSGARGLMQLMPATAAAVAKMIGTPTSATALVTDANHNMRLGTAYLRGVLDQFDGAMPLAFAAYNAGPHRVLEWLAVNGDPRINTPDQPDMVDWIELIPFNETRNYVQRVTENVSVYRAHEHVVLPHPLAGFQRKVAN